MKKKTVLFGLFITSLNAIGQNFLHPVTPDFFKSLNLNDSIFGSSFAVMCLFAFITSPFWGVVANKFGRKPIMIIGAICYGLSQLIFANSTTVVEILIARGLAGFFTGAVTIPNLVYIIDCSKEEKRRSVIAIYGAIMVISTSIGYLIGGTLGLYISPKFAITAQTYFMLGLALIIFLFQAETYKEKPDSIKNLLKSSNPFASFIKAGRYLTPALVMFFISVFFAGVSQGNYDNSFNYFLNDVLDFNTLQNGLFKVGIGIFSLIVNFTLTAWLINKKPSSKYHAIIIICSLLLTITVTFTTKILPLYVITTLIMYSFINTYISMQRNISIEGRVGIEVSILSGLYSGINSLGQVVGSLSSGFIYELFSNKLMSFYFACLTYLITFIFAILFYRLDLRRKTEEQFNSELII